MTDRLACPVPRCGRVRQSQHMMCRTDWTRVTKPTQAEVYRAWRAYSKAAGCGAEPEVFRAVREAYYAVREQAIREAEA